MTHLKTRRFDLIVNPGFEVNDVGLDVQQCVLGLDQPQEFTVALSNLLQMPGLVLFLLLLQELGIPALPRLAQLEPLLFLMFLGATHTPVDDITSLRASPV